MSDSRKPKPNVTAILTGVAAVIGTIAALVAILEAVGVLNMLNSAPPNDTDGITSETESDSNNDEIEADIEPEVEADVESTGGTTRAIAFASDRDGDFEIYLSDSDCIDNPITCNPSVIQLTSNTSDDFGPSWSPDGKQVAFHSDRDGDWDIYVINAECFASGGDCGTNTIQITNDPSTDTFASWSPDGERIVFHSNRDGDRNIYIADTHCSLQDEDCDANTLRVTSHEDSDRNPVWSPDGSEIAFASDRDGDFDIYTIDAVNFTNLRQLTNSNGDDLYPRWSPDGSQIAFHSARSGDFDIYIMNANGSNVQQLTDNSVDDLEPAWSDDGSRIIFMSKVGSSFEIFVIRIGTTSKLSIFAGEDPVWQP